MSSTPVTSLPADILHRAMNELNVPADHSDNKLFLHFMGELLRTASASQNGSSVDYAWFANALTHFDDFLKMTQQTRKPIEYTSTQPQQLRLLESKKVVRSKIKRKSAKAKE